jgi:hypothetical protein
MSGRTRYHTTHKDDHWNFKREGACRQAKTSENKDDAVDYGQDIAKNQDLGQLIIHKTDGTIQTEHPYGKDPYPPKG